MISLWLSPFQAAFKFSSSVFLHILIIVYLLTDILVNLNRSTISKGEIINTRIQIIKNYLKGNGIYDIISLIIWIEIYSSTVYSLVEEIMQIVQIFVTIKKLLTNFDQFFESMFSKGIFTGLTDLVSLIISIYFFSHIMACIWFIIGDKSEQFYQTSWLEKTGIKDESILIQYNYSIYWATTTIVTVGYGDITPQNWVEMTFTTIMMVLSSCVYAYSLNSIGIILKNIQDNKYQFKKMLLRINNFMDQNKVELELQLRARNFLKYQLSQNNQENNEDMKYIMKLLPESLRNSINKDIQNKILNQLTYLKGFFTQSTVNEISKIIETINLTPEEVLYQQNENSDSSLYFIFSGQIVFYEEKSKKVLATLNQGQKFGEYQFFTGLFPQCSAKSLTTTVIYKIQRERLLQIIRQNERDFQKFNEIKDQILQNHDYSKCLAHCNLCNCINHEIINCPLLTYKPNLEQRLKKEQFQQSINGRFYQNRKFTKKKNALLIQKNLEILIKFYQEENNISQNNISDEQTYYKKRPTLDDRSYLILEESKSKLALGDIDIFQQLKAPSQNRISKTQSRKSTQMKPSIVPQIQQQQNRSNQQHQTEFKSQLNVSYKTLSSSKFDMEQQFLDEFCCYHIDKQMDFKDYMIHNNLSNITKQFDKSQSQRKIKLQEIDQPNKYSIYYQVKISGQRMRKNLCKTLEQQKT